MNLQIYVNKENLLSFTIKVTSKDKVFAFPEFFVHQGF
jgi:hypothetical protein